MKEIRWGIIGCGDVTEHKSGPAFSKVENSRLVAVMRRDGKKAADYAHRHQVPLWFDNIDHLIGCPEINAVYIATPPGSHAELALKVAEAGKPCYVEKPMARTFSETLKMTSAFHEAKCPLFVAYYRRALPRFRHLQMLLQQQMLGQIEQIHYRQQNNGNAQMAPGALPWRFQPSISGGGLFIDLGSHTLDLLDFWFGPLNILSSSVQKNLQVQETEDHVAARFTTKDGITGEALWDFNSKDSLDRLEICGSLGKVVCSVFGHEDLEFFPAGKTRKTFPFNPPPHIQQPLIAEIVESLLHGSSCCSTGITAQRTNAVMDQILASAR